MTIPFAIFYQRITEATDIATQIGLAEALGVNRSAITQAKVRNAVPEKWILALARKYYISPDWLEFGTGTPRLENKQLIQQSNQKTVKLASTKQDSHITSTNNLSSTKNIMNYDNAELLFVPKVSAKLCAGGGSYEIDATPVSEHPFPYQWLARIGSPKSMVFMDVIGNSMEPGICDGDMVLVDQANKNLTAHTILAVSVEDSIFLKRVEKRQQGIILHSDNPEYADMILQGDELETFTVIGKIVWLCRDCRWA